ncbi:hypothetical protein [Bacteroides ihuae]|nr:hypothetical protein [Bacteroides ihuae]
MFSVATLRLTVDELKHYRADDVQYVSHAETTIRDSLVYVTGPEAFSLLG